MKVLILVPMAGPLGVFRPGAEAVIDDAEAKRLIEAGYATALGGESVETQMLEAPERAIRPPAKAKRAVKGD